jgi:hypothetical protein
MSPGYYHNPSKPVSTRVRCPVCDHEVYSRAGIHPQCAVAQSESPKPKKQEPVVAVPALQPGAANDRAPDFVNQPRTESLSTPAHAAD